MSEHQLIDGAFYPVRYKQFRSWTVAQYHAGTTPGSEFFEPCGKTQFYQRADFPEIGGRIPMPNDHAPAQVPVPTAPRLDLVGEVRGLRDDVRELLTFLQDCHNGRR